MNAHWVMFAFVAGIALSPFDIRIAAPVLSLVIALSFWRRELVIWALITLGFVGGSVRAGFEPWEMWYLDSLTLFLEYIRDGFAARVAIALPEPQAAYLSGLLLGLRESIPYEIQDAFRQTGTSHLVALSGYNVTIITSYLGKLFAGLWFPVLGVVLFVLGTGAQSSLVRAALMGILVLVAQRTGRDYTPGRALLSAVVLMLLFNPTLLREDVGFQLSIAATAGLIYITPFLEPYVRWLTGAFSIRESLVVTVSAQIATLPIIVYYFGAPSVWAPIANILVIVTIPATMFFGFLAGVAGFVHESAALIIAWPSYVLLSYQLSVIQFFASVSL